MNSCNFIQLSNATNTYTEALKSVEIPSAVSNDKTQKLFEIFYRTARHPAFILDLNVNIHKAQPMMLNEIGSFLFNSCKDLFKESRLEKFNGTLDEFIYSAKRKVAEEIKYLDLLHVPVKLEGEATETTFSLTAWSFEFGKDNKMLGIILTEITKTIQEELNALEIFKESLISALSHELNNPMNSLIPLLKMMPSCFNGEKKEDLKEMALASANILQTKIRDLIDYAKIQQEKIKLNLTEFHVEDLFDKMKRIFKYEVEEKSNSFITKIITQHNKRLLILGDRDRIEQVLVKLLSNANKYTENGTIELMAEENIKNFNVMFSVQDTGIGIPKKVLETLFAPLPQKAKNLETVVRLPGLGLEIAKDLCYYMECKLNVISEENKGSKFFFEIPVCRIALFEETLPPTLFKAVKVHEAPAMLSNHNKEVRRPLFSKKFITKIEKAKMNSDIKRISRKIPLNGSFLSLRKAHPWVPGQSVKGKNELSKFSQNNLVYEIKQNIPITNAAIDTECDISEEIPVVHKLIPQYGNRIRNCLSSIEEGKAVKKELAVLVVDDNYSNRFVVKEMVKAMNINTIQSKNGLEAVNVVEKSFKPCSDKEIALIFMDLSMPIMNGINATIEIRKLEKKYKKEIEIPIVAITGQEAMNDKNKCFEVGMQEYVKKPINKSVLKKIIAQNAPILLNKPNVLRNLN